MSAISLRLWLTSGSRLDEKDLDPNTDLGLGFACEEDLLRPRWRAIRPDPDLTVSKWGDQYRKLPSWVSAEPQRCRPLGP